MSSLFTKIYQGEIPGFLIAENEQAFAILNRYPVQRGHILVLPRQEVGHLFDLDEKLYSDLWAFSRLVAKTLQVVTKAEKIGVVVEGYGIKDHAHIHLLPLNGPDQLGIGMAPEASDAELESFAREFAKVWQK